MCTLGNIEQYFFGYIKNKLGIIIEIGLKG